ncbi:MAG: S8 family serine peptidase, partial [Planctomycetes bacterium]|nr:S8 family serine peptidase [Planctomycetota bacterium]
PGEIGVAPQCDIYSARVVNDLNNVSQIWLENALDELVLTQDCRVVVTGISIPSETADGDSVWTKIYDYYAYQYDVIFANPAGNTTTEIDVIGDAYNGITTGGLRFTDPDVYGRVGNDEEDGNDSSSSGPTYDGRDKPEIVCPSQGQTLPYAGSSTAWSTVGSTLGETSYSVPHTGGVAALLLSYADSTVVSDDGRSEVIKAVIVNSALPNIDDKDGNPTTMQTFNEDRGYGRIDALRAYETLNETLTTGKITKGSTTTKQMGWAYDTLPSGGDSYFITAYKDQRLIVTVTWHRYMSSSYSTENSPFGINLTVEDQGNNVIFSETDTLNNLEKVDILLTSDGIYEIKLDKINFRSGRDYGLAFELVDPIPGDFDLDYVVDEGDLAYLTSDWLTTAIGLQTDLYDDGSNTVNLSDFAEFSKYWLIYDPAYYSP